MHKVQFEAGSQLAKMFGVTELVTNSTHHQAVKKVAPGFRIVVRAVDSTAEGIESTEGLPIWGVQFHPEGMIEDGNEVALDFFKSFVRKVKSYKR
jgi:gamma-glutamyl-gamma-aminobutyrate hydrolase PuuD